MATKCQNRMADLSAHMQSGSAKKWDVRWCMTGKCEEITQQHFQTENEAFDLAHDNFLQLERQVYRKVPGSDED